VSERCEPKERVEVEPVCVCLTFFAYPLFVASSHLPLSWDTTVVMSKISTQTLFSLASLLLHGVIGGGTTKAVGVVLFA